MSAYLTKLFREKLRLPIDQRGSIYGKMVLTLPSPACVEWLEQRCREPFGRNGSSLKDVMAKGIWNCFLKLVLDDFADISDLGKLLWPPVVLDTAGPANPSHETDMRMLRKHVDDVLIAPPGVQVVIKELSPGDQPEAQLLDFNHVRCAAEKNEHRLQAHWWRFIRFLVWHSGEPLHSLAFMHRSVVAEAQARALKGLIGIDRVSTAIGNHLSKFHSPALPRGTVLWGPPGTGKTMIVGRLCDELGLVALYQPMSAADFQRGFKGDANRAFDELLERGNKLCWMGVYVFIDEIDALAPQRSAVGGGEEVAQLAGALSAIGGSKDKHRNIALFGGTNRLRSIDEAFRRRLDTQVFVGVPNFQARAEWISASARRDDVDFLLVEKDGDVLTWPPSLAEFAVRATMGFSNDAMVEFLRHLLRDPPVEKAKVIKYAKLLSESAAAAQSRFRGKCVVEWLGGDGGVGDCTELANCSYFVDLTGKSIESAATIVLQYRDADRVCCIAVNAQTPVRDTMNDRIDFALQKALDWARSDKFRPDTVRVFDRDYLIERDALAVEKALGELLAIRDECQQYATALLVIDLDGVVGVTKQHTGFGSDGAPHSGRFYDDKVQLSYHFERAALLRQCCDIFASNGSTKVFMTAFDPYLAGRVKEALGGWDTAVDIKQREEDEAARVPKQCVWCNKWFRPSESAQLTSDCYQHVAGTQYGVVIRRSDVDSSDASKATHFQTVAREAGENDAGLRRRARQAMQEQSGDQLRIYSGTWKCCGKQLEEAGELPRHSHES